ncbi:hypothetical protein GCM10022277_01850 [Litoribacillus peritrichatus]|uniref:Uncharacterized protein n=1 Tax=Litoribacillus peritrichatus TaxID=718191 RepID=A0ABP7LY69_9GAMM
MERYSKPNTCALIFGLHSLVKFETTMSNSNYIRRTPEQWQAIINDFSAPDLSGLQFCKQKIFNTPTFVNGGSVY